MVVDTGSDSAGHDSSTLNAKESQTGNRAENSTGDATGRGEAGSGDGRSRRPLSPDLPDPRQLAQDWITLWQSELSAIAADPEMRESWQTVMALWAGTMSAMLRGMPRAPAADRYDRADGQSRTADAPRAPPAAPAPDARDAEIERLARHVATLERRLADLERGSDPPVRPKRRAPRKSGK